MSIAENLNKVRERIRAACSRADRNAVEVRLVAVSKAHAIEKIREAFACEQKLFGENYVQEALPKRQALPQAEWHFIGQLQSNKAKQVVGEFALIHSVDRENLLQEISKRAVEKNIVQKILLEVNLAGEANKGGANWKTIETMWLKAQSLPGVSVHGLMGMPPAGPAEKSRQYFREMRERAEAWKLKELSMGTTQDFEIAIEEGATLVRIGTEIFGQRN